MSAARCAAHPQSEAGAGRTAAAAIRRRDDPGCAAPGPHRNAAGQAG